MASRRPFSVLPFFTFSFSSTPHVDRYECAPRSKIEIAALRRMGQLGGGGGLLGVQCTAPRVIWLIYPSPYEGRTILHYYCIQRAV